MKDSSSNFFLERRKALNLTRFQLAQILMVYPSTIQNWEKGLSMPQRRLLPEVAAALQVSLEELGRAIAKTRRVA